MNTEQILAEWKNDIEFDRSDISHEAIRLSNLHQKYLEIYYFENAKLIKARNNYNMMKRIRTEYWLGKSDSETLKKYDWKPQPLIIIKAELSLYLDSDEILQEFESKFEMLKSRVSIVENILKHITNRGYNIKSVIDYERFKAGQ